MSKKLIYLYLAGGLFLSCSSHHHEETEEDHHHAPGLEISEEKAKDFGIEYEKAKPGVFHHVIKTSGSIEASTADVFTASAKKSGIIRLASGVNEGVYVRKGETIGFISSDEMEGGDSSKAAAANLEAAKAEYERLKPLYEEGLVTTSTFKEAERAYKEAEAMAGKSGKGATATVAAPGDGNVIQLNVRTGEFVEAGTPIATIAKNSSQILKADLPSREAIHMMEIETANFKTEGSREIQRLADLNGKRISGNSIGGAVNGYVPVYFSFSGNPLTAPGGFAEIYLICGDREDVISVDRDAILEIQGRKYIYVEDDHHGLEKRLVKTGATDGQRVEITDGLSEGETYVAKGASIVRMEEVSSIAPPAHNHSH